MTFLLVYGIFVIELSQISLAFKNNVYNENDH